MGHKVSFFPVEVGQDLISHNCGAVQATITNFGKVGFFNNRDNFMDDPHHGRHARLLHAFHPW